MLMRTLKTILASAPAWRAIAPTRQPGLIVVMYHRINRGGEPFFGLPVAAFREQIRWLKRNCRIIGPDEVAGALAEPRRVRPNVLITFDDGFRDYHDNAYPVLHELKAPALVFVATSFIDAGGMIWTDFVHLAARLARHKQCSLPWNRDQTFDLSDSRQRSRYVSEAKKHLKVVPNAERQALIAQMLQDMDPGDVDAQAGRQMLTWDEVNAVSELTTIGGHTHTHPILSRVSLDDARTEIATCYQRIHERTGRKPKYFAYPNGRTIDYSPEVQRIVRDVGFELAYSTNLGVNDATADRFALRRQPGDAATIGEFARLLSVRTPVARQAA